MSSKHLTKSKRSAKNKCSTKSDGLLIDEMGLWWKNVMKEREERARLCTPALIELDVLKNESLDNEMNTTIYIPVHVELDVLPKMGLDEEMNSTYIYIVNKTSVDDVINVVKDNTFIIGISMT